VAQLGDWLVLLAIQLGEAALHLIHRWLVDNLLLIMSLS